MSAVAPLAVGGPLAAVVVVVPSIIGGIASCAARACADPSSASEGHTP